MTLTLYQFVEVISLHWLVISVMLKVESWCKKFSLVTEIYPENKIQYDSCCRVEFVSNI